MLCRGRVRIVPFDPPHAPPAPGLNPAQVAHEEHEEHETPILETVLIFLPSNRVVCSIARQGLKNRSIVSTLTYSPSGRMFAK